jgi:pSer/pThr/pTyr-binding forkhead associated (FHA) protein
MTCTTCGRENPPHLTFCQECGQRLGPRIAPPTPPIGLGNQDAYGPPPNPIEPRALPPPAQPGLQPRVATSLGTPLEQQQHPPHHGAVGHGANSDRRCKICDTVNGPHLRYCTSCGSTLEPAPQAAAAPAPQVSAPPQQAHQQQQHQHHQQQQQPPNPAIAPMRVVDLGQKVDAPPAGATRVCTRCRGAADASAQFCKFCGASLPDAAHAAHAAANGVNDLGGVVPAAAAPPIPQRGPTAPIPQAGLQGLPQARAAPAPSASPIAPQPSHSPQPAAHQPSNYGPPPAAAAAAALAAIPRSPSAPPPAAAAAAAQAPAAAPGPSRAPAVQPSTAPQRGRLVVIAKSGADGPSYPFGDLLDIGRVEGNVIVGEDPYLSPRHVRILWQGGKLFLRDLASTNGVYLRLAPSRDTSLRRNPDSPEVAVPLVDQDLILVGQQVLRFDILKEGEGGFGPAQEHGTLLFGSPAAPRYARLCQRTVEGIARDVYYVRKVETVLGRESGDVVFTEDPFLSRRHAAIRLLSRDGSVQGSKPPPGDARFALVDLGSSNGTFLRIRGDVELSPGDHFRVGQQLFRVDFDGRAG